VPEQRKLVSILFADFVGSTALATKTDPEVVSSAHTSRPATTAERRNGPKLPVRMQVCSLY
jgi:class 3 adenylate cyclase